MTHYVTELMVLKMLLVMLVMIEMIATTLCIKVVIVKLTAISADLLRKTASYLAKYMGMN